MNNSAKEAALTELYATLPRLECKGLCLECCGAITITRRELRRLEDAGHKLKVKKIPSGWNLDTGDSPHCPLLKEGQCTVYEIRPAICRLWGLTERLKCPFGCVPERVLTEDEAYQFMLKVFKLGA